jgi:hypothetical protein
LCGFGASARRAVFALQQVDIGEVTVGIVDCTGGVDEHTGHPNGEAFTVTYPIDSYQTGDVQQLTESARRR